MSTYSESAVREFYNQEESKYRSIWTDDGSVHFGYFSEHPDEASMTFLDQYDDAFLKAVKKWDAIMLKKAGIDENAKVLDLGCGNGTIAFWLAKTTGAQVVGVDLSDVRIGNAQKRLQEEPQANLQFQKGSATELPFEDGHFTHVWSQATLCHIPNIKAAFSEIYRVLKSGGTFTVDDLVKGETALDEDAQKYVYDRLLIGDTCSHKSYGEALSALGFKVEEGLDLTKELRSSYGILSQRAGEAFPEHEHAYSKTCDAINKRQLGWSFFKAVK